jgi:hypothetical protein
MEYFIYTLSDPIDKEIKYIGKTKNLKDRLQRHMNPCNLKQTWQSKTKWLKYLKNNNLKPIMELLDQGDENNIDDLEIYWISQFKSWGFKLKNETIGGQNPTLKGSKLKKSHIDNLKKSIKTKKIVVQYTIDDIFVAKYESISEAKRQTGLSHISSCCRGKRKSTGIYYFRFKDNYYPYVKRIEYWTGAHHTEETRKKLKMNHPLRKVICQYNIDTDELINEYLSSYDAENSTGLRRGHICKCCKAVKSFNSVGGYYFRFKDNYFPFVKQYASMGKLSKNYNLDIN